MGGTARVNEGGRPGSLTSWQNSITAKGYSSQQSSYVKKPTGWLSTVRPPIDGSNLSHRLYVGTACNNLQHSQFKECKTSPHRKQDKIWAQSKVSKGTMV